MTGTKDWVRSRQLMPGTEFLNPCWVWSNYCQKQSHSLGFDPAACLCCLGQALGMNSECSTGTKWAPAEQQCPASSAPPTCPASHTQDQSSHPCKGGCGAAPAEGSVREAQLCWQTETKRKDRRRREYPQMSEVQHSSHYWSFSLKNNVNRAIYTYLKSEDFINWSLLFCGTTVCLFGGLSNTAITATHMSLV